MAPQEAVATCLIGVMGGIVATPMLMAALRERFSQTEAAYHLERAADSSTDRAVSALERAAAVKILAAVVLPMMLGPAIAAAWEWYVWSKLEAEGLPVQAQVTGLGGFMTWRSAANVTYCFQVAAISYTATQEISGETQQALHLGDALPVRYLPADPSLSRLDGDTTYRQFVTRLTIIASGFSLMLLAMIAGRRTRTANAG